MTPFCIYLYKMDIGTIDEEQSDEIARDRKLQNDHALRGSSSNQRRFVLSLDSDFRWNLTNSSFLLVNGALFSNHMLLRYSFENSSKQPVCRGYLR